MGSDRRSTKARKRHRARDGPFGWLRPATSDARSLRTHQEGRPDWSAYRDVWLFAMFDLPVLEKEERRQYAQFRKALLTEGFTMLQFSVYARHCASEESSEAIRARVRQVLPPAGQVRVLGVTDRQFGKMEVYFGKNRKPSEEPPSQLMLF